MSFWLEFIDKTGEKVFVYKCKLSLSLALLYLVDLFINKLKTKFNNLFYRMILNTKRIHNSFWRNFPARAKQMPSKVLFVGKKKRRPRQFGHCAPKLETFRFWEEYDYEYEIFSMVSSARAWAGVIWAGKRGSRRHSTTSFSESVIVARTSYQMLEVL